MSDTHTTPLTKLPVAERLKLIEELWDSIDAETDDQPMPDWHNAELDKRLAALDAGTSVGAPWEDVRRRITGKQ